MENVLMANETEWSNDESLVHADGNFVLVASKTADFLEAEMRALPQNAHLPTDAQLCHGCLMTLAINTVLHLFKNHRHEDVNPSVFMMNVATGLRDLSRGLALEADITGESQHDILAKRLRDEDLEAMEGL